MKLKQCIICLEDIIKTDKINCTTCNCKGSIGSYHDTCLDVYLDNSFENKRIICGICHTKFNFSRNLCINRVIKYNKSEPELIVIESKPEITEEDLKNSNDFYRPWRRILVSFIRIIISIILLNLTNNYYKYLGIIIFPFNNIKKIYNFFINTQIVSCIILCIFIDKITKESIDYVANIITISYIINLIIYLSFCYIILYSLINKYDLFLGGIFYILLY